MEASQRITRRSASNLALAFILLPREKRLGMTALYAFCREVDDIADDESQPVAKRQAELIAWREDVRMACESGEPRLAVNRDLRAVIQQYHLPFALFDELIRGVEMDLHVKRYADYASLELYCYRVASVVGLLSIEIFGGQDPACHLYAEYLGKALQLTNILRDVAVDAERGRIYLPQSELARFSVTEQEILNSAYSERYYQLAVSVAGQAREFYHRAREILPEAERKTMIAAELMGSVYWELLLALEAERFEVFRRPLIRLSKGRKIGLILRTWWRITAGSSALNYGTPN